MTIESIADTTITALATIFVAWITAKVSSLEGRISELERRDE